MRSVVVIGLENCVQSCVDGVLDVLEAANGLCMETGEAAPFGPLKVATEDGRPVRAFGGRSVRADMSLADCEPPDLAVVPALLGGLDAALTLRKVVAALRRWHAAGTCVCTVCAGAFLLAATGALDGREATTHWQLAPQFRALFPKVRLRPERMLVDGGSTICAGGVTAYLDLALHLSGRFGSPELAARCARLLLIDPGRDSQAVYGCFTAPENHGDEPVLQVQHWLAENAAQPITLAAMADVAHLTERTLTRRFRRAVGDSPLGYLRALRVERARRLLETTTLPVEHIVTTIGYEDPASFRRLFKTTTGLPPGAYRRRFGQAKRIRG